MSQRISLPLRADLCLGCGRPVDGPHDEECIVDEHYAALAGEAFAQALHDPDECPLCLATRELISSCRCGRCCESLIIEASAFDAQREPKIRERGSMIRDDEALPPELADWLLNGPGGPCVFFRRDAEGRGVCEIYATRPLACRLFNCDTDERAVEFRFPKAQPSTPEGV
jgi:Fe-S-cluster containining protein